MKKTKKTLLTAAALAAAFNMAACTAPVGEESSVPDGSSCDPSLSGEYNVYGPPRDESDADESAQTSSASEDTSSKTDSSKNDSSKSDSSKAEASSADETSEYDPSEDVVYEVYGPPADDEDTDIPIPDDDDGGYTTTIYAPEYDPEYYPEYDPEYEEIQIVYGPPPELQEDQ